MEMFTEIMKKNIYTLNSVAYSNSVFSLSIFY